ncbi:alpha/beta hydrolase [Streptomyces zingiberis]|uniref:Alpha/beta fold hydrolase n=1 Tax=Streptomyces zingiberis TaxID=2053010 RepID=A0ABX1C363_9ACTN|nr:alpha/beta fold hydrolase [Streptomyces zingiberis]NJQ02352.1 alpha/beta fold hydrolase [Streptomyces zingiberis]
MQVLPGAEPFHHDGGDIGVLLCHGFTGSPQSLRPWAGFLAERGLTVSLPLLPGHGTRWQDMQLTGWQDWYAEVDRALRALSARCRRVFVFGLSMGGSLALRLAVRHGDGVAGLVLVNPANRVHGLSAYALPVARHLVRTTKGLASDIAKGGTQEAAYDRVPLHAAHSFRGFLRVLDAELPRVKQPLLLMHSARDHVVPPADSARILDRVTSADLTEVVLERSYHVATLDHDAELIFQKSWEFVRRLSGQETATAGADTGADTGTGPDAGADTARDAATDAGAETVTGTTQDTAGGTARGPHEGTATGG